MDSLNIFPLARDVIDCRWNPGHNVRSYPICTHINSCSLHGPATIRTQVNSSGKGEELDIQVLQHHQRYETVRDERAGAEISHFFCTYVPSVAHVKDSVIADAFNLGFHVSSFVHAKSYRLLLNLQ